MKHLTALLLLLAAGLGGNAAEMPQRVARAAAQVKSTPALTATFTANGTSGSLLMGDGGKFVLHLGDAHIYYDGKTQWAYSAADNEATSFTPTADELLQANPASILANLDTAFKAVKAPGNDTYRLTPTDPGQEVTEVTVVFPASGTWPNAMTIKTGGMTVNATAMKFTAEQTKRPLSAFQFTPPAGCRITKL